MHHVTVFLWCIINRFFDFNRSLLFQLDVERSNHLPEYAAEQEVLLLQ